MTRVVLLQWLCSAKIRHPHASHQAYAQHFDLLPLIRFNTRVVSLTQDPSTACWTVVVQDLYNRHVPLHTLQASFLVVATGNFSRPFVPLIEVRGPSVTALQKNAVTILRCLVDRHDPLTG